MQSMLRRVLPLFALCLAFTLRTDAQNQHLLDSLYQRACTATIDSVKVTFYNKCAAFCIRYDISKTERYLKESTALTEHFSTSWSDSSCYNRHKAWVLYLHGNYHLRQSNFPEALDYYQKALQLYEKTRFFLGVGNCYNGIGGIYYSLQEIDKATYYYELAGQLYEKTGNIEGSMVVYSNMGIILSNKGDYQGAIRQLRKSEQLITTHQLVKHEASIVSELAKVFLKVDSFDQAKAYTDRAHKLFEQSKDLIEYCSFLLNISIEHRQHNNIEQALRYCEQGLEVAKRSQSKTALKESYLQLQKIYLELAAATVVPALKDSFFLRAFEYNARERAYQDSLFNADKSGQLAELQIKYETEKKEREISQLSTEAKNREIEILRREVQLRQEKIKAEKALQQSLLLEKNNADYALQLAVQASETQVREQQIALLNHEKERSEAEQFRERQLRYALLAGLAALALIAFLLLRLNWLKTAANRKIRQQQTEIEAQNSSLEAANRFKSIFLSNMSHEIRTPLNTIIGITGLLAKTPLDEKQKEYSDVLKYASENLLAVINEILDFSKIEAGKIEFKPRRVSLHELLQRQAGMMRYAATQKNISLQLELSPDLPQYVVCDPGRLNQILLNLLGNAVKFTEKGGVVLRARAHAPESADQQVELAFEVEDSGAGIAAHELPHIFNAFQQAGENTHLRYEGTGLGLSITKQLVELQGGKISVESRPGQGSIFRFTLPVSTADAEMPEIPGDTPDEAMLPSCRILLVEDNQFNQLLAVELFKKMVQDVQISIAPNGISAVEQATAEAFDIIFMDIKMPLMDGFAATRALRAGGLRTPIIALTANATSSEQAKCLEAGMDDYLSKPIDPALLKKALLRWT